MKIYLFVNAALYLLLAIWCTVKPTETATSIGYTQLDASGRSEYLVIYGGLQLGLAAMFSWLGAHAALHRTGIVLSLFFYAPLVVYRVVTVAMFQPVGVVTFATGVLEVSLFIAALALWFAKKPATA